MDHLLLFATISWPLLDIRQRRTYETSWSCPDRRLGNQKAKRASRDELKILEAIVEKSNATIGVLEGDSLCCTSSTSSSLVVRLVPYVYAFFELLYSSFGALASVLR